MNPLKVSKNTAEYTHPFFKTDAKLLHIFPLKKRNIKSVKNDTMLESEPDLQLTDVEHPPKYYSFWLQYSSKFLKGCFSPAEMKCELLHLEWEMLPFLVLVYTGFFNCIFNYKDA